MRYVVALNRHQFHYYCTKVADPPINPQRPDVVYLGTNDEGTLQRCRGRMFNPQEDELIYYGDYSRGKHTQYLREILLTIGARDGVVVP